MKQTAENFLINKLNETQPNENRPPTPNEVEKWLVEFAENQQQGYCEEEVLNLLTHFAVEILRQNKRGQFPIEIKGWFERNKEKYKNGKK